MSDNFPSNDNNNNNNKNAHKNVGDKIRKMINEPAESKKFKETYMHVLNGTFTQISSNLHKTITSSFQSVFNQFSSANEDSKDIFLAVKLTTPEKQGGYSPLLRIGLPFVTTFTEIEPRDLFECNGYIELHKKAREMNVAVGLKYIFTEETQNNPFGQGPILVIDARYTYEQGMRKQPRIYPELPPMPKEKPSNGKKPKSGGSFKL